MTKTTIFLALILKIKKIIGWIIVLAFVLGMISADQIWGLPGLGILGFLIFGIKTIGDVLKYRKTKIFKKTNLIITMVSFSYVVIFTLIVSAYFRQNELQGNRIVNAIEAFRKDHGSYPRSIDEIIPTYIDKLPDIRCLPLAGASYSYRYIPNQGGSLIKTYTLQGECGYVSIQYISEKKKWERISD